MADSALFQESLEALKALNNAMVAIRVYPAQSPQLRTAVERGYKILKHYIHKHDLFSIAVTDTRYFLGDEELQKDILQTIPNLVLYRQLQLLDSDRLTLLSGFDRAVFKQLLLALSAKVDRIKEHGGGQALLHRLNLENYFRETKSETDSQKSATAEATAPDVSPQVVQIRREFAEYLFSTVHNASIAKVLEDLFLKPGEGGRILASCIALVVRDMIRKGQVTQSAVLTHCFDKCERLLSPESSPPTLRETARLLLSHLSLQALMIICVQKFPQQLGADFVETLAQMMTFDRFTELLALLNENYGQLHIKDENDPRLELFASAMRRLLGTSRGKQYIGQEKAKKLLQEGEEDRRRNRTQTGLASVIAGNPLALQSAELLALLPESISRLTAAGNTADIEALLNTLAKYVEQEKPVASSVFDSLACIAEDLAGSEKWRQLSIITEPLLWYLQQADKGGATVEKSVVALNALMHWAFTKDQNELGDRILSVLHQLRFGQENKSSAVQAIVGRIQDRTVTRQSLNQLLILCLQAPMDENLSRRFVYQGPVAAEFLLDTLIRSESKEDRIKIIDLLTCNQSYLAPLLLKKLAEPMPWFGKRNILKLLADAGKPEILETVYPYICHEDLRIQREAFLCVYKISGERRKEALRYLLGLAGEILKVQIVKALQPFIDAEILADFKQILEDREHYSTQVRDELIATVLQVIGHSNEPEALQLLTDFLAQREKRSTKNLGAGVWIAAEKAIKHIQSQQTEEKRRQAMAHQLRRNAMRKVSATLPVQQPTAARNITGLAEEENIHSLLGNGETDQACQALLELIEDVAKQRRFSQADQLKEWLTKLDPNNLSGLIRASEIIEDEKKGAIDKSHLDVWSELYDNLTTEEFTTFYHALVHHSFADEEIIARKGEKQNSLFFINSGKVKLFYRDKGSDLLIKTMGRGEVLGSGTFFDISIWTVSASSIGKTEISMLAFETMQMWQEFYPDLEAKLRGFCHKFETVTEFFKKSGNDRRRSERFKLRGLVAMSLLGEDGSLLGVSSKGLLIDISSGGLSFSLRITNKGNARQLLGRSIKTEISPNREEAALIAMTGQVVAVRALHTVELEYSIHVQFFKKLERTPLQSLFSSLKSS